MTGWTYYNHAMIPTTMPHEEPDLTPLQTGELWNIHGGGTPLFARWTTDFDCENETSFWACILDKPFEVDQLKSNRRYKITKGNRNFYTRLLNSEDLEAMYDVYLGCLPGYGGAITPVSREAFLKEWGSIMQAPETVLIGACSRGDDSLCGYAHCIDRGKYIPISSFKSKVCEEKKNVNFALMDGICSHFREALENGSYLCDGWRNVLHETEFQSWLEKYFQFRKAYCHLHLKYRFPVNLAVAALYPFRKQIAKIPKLKPVYAVLIMEEWSRQSR